MKLQLVLCIITVPIVLIKSNEFNLKGSCDIKILHTQICDSRNRTDIRNINALKRYLKAYVSDDDYTVI